MVFDVGNVLLTWDPLNVVHTVFPDEASPQSLTQAIFKSEIWLDLNRGLITENEAVSLYRKQLPAIFQDQFEELMRQIKISLTPIPGSFELLEKLHKNHVPLYSITDNVKEIVEDLKVKYDFWQKFTGLVVSADVGVLKPAPEIYLHLLQDYQLNPSETLFIDDHLPNVIGAHQVGMSAFQFIDAVSCERILRNEYKIKF